MIAPHRELVALIGHTFDMVLRNRNAPLARASWFALAPPTSFWRRFAGYRPRQPAVQSRAAFIRAGVQILRVLVALFGYRHNARCRR